MQMQPSLCCWWWLGLSTFDHKRGCCCCCFDAHFPSTQIIPPPERERGENVDLFRFVSFARLIILICLSAAIRLKLSASKFVFRGVVGCVNWFVLRNLKIYHGLLTLFWYGYWAVVCCCDDCLLMLAFFFSLHLRYLNTKGKQEDELFALTWRVLSMDLSNVQRKEHMERAWICPCLTLRLCNLQINSKFFFCFKLFSVGYVCALLYSIVANRQSAA